MEDYPWKVPLPAGSKVFRGIRIYYQDGIEEMITPEEGQHVVVMTWLEVEKTQSQVPGLIIYHSDTEIVSKMIDRLFRKYPQIWENIQKLWYMRGIQEEFVDRMKLKFSGRSRSNN